MDLNYQDIRRDTFRSGCPAYHPLESWVRLTHMPTGVIAECNESRSQHKNEKVAMEELKFKVLLHKAMIEELKEQNNVLKDRL